MARLETIVLQISRCVDGRKNGIARRLNLAFAERASFRGLSQTRRRLSPDGARIARTVFDGPGPLTQKMSTDLLLENGWMPDNEAWPRDSVSSVSPAAQHAVSRTVSYT
jgi:hypothetical protein